MTYRLPEGWKRVKLGEVVSIVSGGTPKRKEESYWNGDIPWISVKDFPDNEKYINETEEKITEEGLKNSSTNLLHKDDIIISARGTVGKLAMIRYPMTFNQSCYGLRGNELIIDKSYLYYFLRSTIESLKNQGHGSVFNTIIRDTLIRFEILLPPLIEQKSIADTLSALDDKIEINNKINANLEAQAQAIFKHWFIDFEFPDENGNPYKSSGGEMEESELGMIPKEWEVGSLGDSILGKLISSGIDEFIGEKIYLATADVNGTNIVNNEALITRKDKPSRANMQPKSNTIWFAKMKDSRKLIFVHKRDEILKEKYIFSTGFAGIQGTEDSIYYLWTYIQSEIFDSIKNNLCSGTTMQAINNTNINKIKVKIPGNYILEKFNTIVEPFYIKIINNRNENQKLSQLRDTLLPKLMSGKIRTLLDDIGGD